MCAGQGIQATDSTVLVRALQKLLAAKITESFHIKSKRYSHFLSRKSQKETDLPCSDTLTRHKFRLVDVNVTIILLRSAGDTMNHLNRKVMANILFSTRFIWPNKNIFIGKCLNISGSKLNIG